MFNFYIFTFFFSSLIASSSIFAGIHDTHIDESRFYSRKTLTRECLEENLVKAGQGDNESQKSIMEEIFYHEKKIEQKFRERVMNQFLTWPKMDDLKSTTLYAALVVSLYQHDERYVLERENAGKIIMQNAREGDNFARFMLGGFYLNGALGFPKDMEKAIFWLKKASNEGSSMATFNLGMMHFTNNDMENMDPKAAIGLIMNAALNGNAEAQCCMGSIHTQGYSDLLERDPTRSFYFFLKSAQGCFWEAEQWAKDVLFRKRVKNGVVKTENMQDVRHSLKKDLEYLQFCHDFFHGLSKGGYKDAREEKAEDLKTYGNLLDYEEKLLSFLETYPVEGFMINGIGFSEKAPVKPDDLLWNRDVERRNELLAYYPRFGAICVGEEAVAYGNFLTSFLFDNDCEDGSGGSNDSLSRWAIKFLKEKAEEEKTRYNDVQASRDDAPFSDVQDRLISGQEITNDGCLIEEITNFSLEEQIKAISRIRRKLRKLIFGDMDSRNRLFLETLPFLVEKTEVSQ